eukprot:4498059-Pleurochrysis_carterae.AAC.1
MKELLDRLRRAAERRRTTVGAPRLDIAALVQEMLDVDLEAAVRTDLVVKAAQEAARGLQGGGRGA